MNSTVPTSDEFSTKTYRVPVENLDKLESQIAKLNKHCVKVNFPEVIINYTERKVEPINNSSDELREYQYLTIDGKAPSLSGWSFVGKLEDLDGETIVKSTPGIEIPEKFKYSPIHCEHCNKKVRRNDTFIVRNGDEFKQVGRSCLRDFLGHADPKFYADMAQFISDIDNFMEKFEKEESYGSGKPMFPVELVLAVAFAVIERDKGFFPSSSEYPTSVSVSQRFVKGDKHPLTITDEHTEKAKNAIEWIKTKIDDHNDFIQNLIKIVKAQYVPHKYFGFLSAMAWTYLKHVEKMKVVPNEKDEISNEPIADIGKKVKFDATVISAIQYQGTSYSYYDNGLRKVLIIKTDDNKLIKAFTSNLKMEKGTRVTVSGSIGKYEVETYEKSPYKGNMITSMAPRARITIKGESE
jgi:hypothetical protein